MSTHVLTLVAHQSLYKGEVERVTDSLKGLDISIGEIEWLAADKACDIYFERGQEGEVERAAEQALQGAKVDCFAQVAEGRRKSLLLADMDSTIIAEESLDELAGFLGLKEKIAAITARAMAGELDFEAAVTERVGLLEGLAESAILEAVDEMTINPGAKELVATMKANGAECYLVSGGFEHFTGAVAAQLGFDGHQGNRLEIADGKMTGRISGEIRNQEAKLVTLKEKALALGIDLAATMTVGDGANDVAMLQAAGAGVAYHAKPVAAAAARFRVQHTDLSSLLFIQGYKAVDFAS
ncbi:MAG: phosphoserine phosphatase SerB [Alphaproteobacteria bacterium]|nr:phosphoserine phosphatase SerB [Alphaproteobacteria bacterium SS10]